MARPKIYANAAERQAAYRENNARVDLVLSKELNATLDDIAHDLDLTKNSLVNAILRFALTNHNWKTQGAAWKKK